MKDDIAPERIYVRTEEGAIGAVRTVLPPTVNPETPEEVEATRPSDALAAEDAASTAFTSLFLGLGAVALLVGGIGIANVMVIAVIERRSEIGLRRALGATKAHIRRQFLTEAIMLAGAGGVVGVGLGAAVTAIYASTKNWEVVVPPIAIVGGVVAARDRRHRRSVPGSALHACHRPKHCEATEMAASKKRRRTRNIATAVVCLAVAGGAASRSPFALRSRRPHWRLRRSSRPRRSRPAI